MLAFKLDSWYPVRLTRRLLRDRSGATAVEIGLVAPMMLMLIIGIVDFGRALQVRGDLSRAVGGASRALNLDPELSFSAIREEVTGRLGGYDGGLINVNVTGISIDAITYASIRIDYRFESVFNAVLPEPITLRVETLAPRIEIPSS